jgi:acyl carrier protein
MVSPELKRIVLSQLELESWDLDDASNAGTVPGWDSLSHARIIAAVEDAYRVRFGTREIMKLTDLGQLQALVDRKTA